MKQNPTTVLFYCLLFFLVGAFPCRALIDLDADGLDDIWEAFFSAQSVSPTGDDDNDGQNNRDECVAGTNPFDALSIQELDIERVADELVMTLPTEQGKFYKVFGKSALEDASWSPLGIEFVGSGEDLKLRVPADGGVDVRGGVTAEIWADISGSNLSVLRNQVTYPGTPDGTEMLSRLQRPRNWADNYGGRIRGYIIPPESGDYTFYIASRNQGDFFLSADDSTNNLSRIAWCYNGGTAHEQWDFVVSQKSVVQTLVAGQRYYFEVEHKHAGLEDHLSVAWEGPGIPGPGPLVIEGAYLSPWFDSAASNVLQFLRVSVEDIDSDGDGLVDWAEHLMGNFNPFDGTSTTSGTNDLSTINGLLVGTNNQMRAGVSNNNAYEISANTQRNIARFTIHRTGGLQPTDIYYSLGAPTDPAKGWPDASDYTSEDIDGNPIAGMVHLPFGATAADVVIAAVPDDLHEYPETVVMTVEPGAGYMLDAQQTAEVLLYDIHPNVATNNLFFALYSPQSGTDSVGFGIATLVVDGNNQIAMVNNEFSALSSVQLTSHVSKSLLAPDNLTLMNGPAVKPILDPTTSLPILGQVSGYSWDIAPSGAYNVNQIVDSLWGQNGQTPLYLNVQTEDYPTGEIWGFFSRLVGSTELEIPADPPAIPVVANDELTREVSRFLTQATFGPTDAEVSALVNEVNTTHAGDRMAAFDAWIDDQFAMDQTLLTDLTLATDQWEFDMGGHYDYIATNWIGTGSAPASPTRPSVWPTLGSPDISGFDSLNESTWRVPTGPYPLSGSEINRYDDFSPRLANTSYRNRRHGHWLLMLGAKDQLRQRLAYSWSQILVVSAANNTVQNLHLGSANYFDMLGENADDHFREMLEDVSYHPIMGKYLSHLKNQKAVVDPGTGEVIVSPDENYAREIMQLFSIGLLQRHLDGTIKLGGEGLPLATYNNDDITELARVFTGFSFSKYVVNQTTWHTPVDNDNFDRSQGNNYYGGRYEYPMKMFGDFHDPDPKSLFGSIEINNTNVVDLSVRGTMDVADALDALAGHENAGPFVSRLMIQRLVTSNPSRGYVYRVAKAFSDGGGDLKAMVKAILLDYEARNIDLVSQVGYGKVREPLMRYVSLLRAAGAKSNIPLAPVSNWGYPASQLDNFPAGATLYRYGNTTDRLGQSPLRAPSVFNWFLPDYKPGGAIASAGLFAPEMQLVTEGLVVEAVNYVYQIAIGTDQSVTAMLGYGGNDDDVFIDKQALIDFWENAPGDETDKDFALIDKVDDLLMAGRFGDLYLAAPIPNPRTMIFDVLHAYTETSAQVNEKVEHLLYLMTSCPEYIVQK